MSDLTIANTILQQLGGGRRLVAMVGAAAIVGGERSLSVRFPNKRGPNSLQVILDADDTYTVIFHRIRAGNVTETFRANGIYCDQLVDLFERQTGLFLTL